MEGCRLTALVSQVLPPDFDAAASTPYPLVISLHPAIPGGQEQHHLTDAAGAQRTGRDIVAPRAVVWASFKNEPPPGSGMYMQKADGSDLWESFVIEEFIPFIEQKYCCGGDQSRVRAACCCPSSQLPC